MHECMGANAAETVLASPMKRGPLGSEALLCTVPLPYREGVEWRCDASTEEEALVTLPFTLLQQFLSRAGISSLLSESLIRI